jgi:hypothetical protein
MIVRNETGRKIQQYYLDLEKVFKTYVILEFQQSQIQIQESQKIVELKDKEIKKITQNHEQYLKRKRRNPYEVGNVVYVVSNKAFTCYFKADYYKIGEASQKSEEDDSAVRGLPLTNPILIAT